MFFPYKDDNPRILIPYVTYVLLVMNILIFIYQHFLLGPASQYIFTLRFGLIPSHLWGGDVQAIMKYHWPEMSPYFQSATGPIDLQLLPGFMTLFTSAFLHGDWWHIIGNMLFLYVFADNIEGALGHIRFALFYLVTALVAGLVHAAIEPGSMDPVIGASGAISGVLGGYLVRYPRARIHVLVFIVIFVTTLRLPAVVVLGWWFVIQALYGIASLQVQASGGVAWFEHIGGFVAGFSYMAIITKGRKFIFKHGRRF